MKYDYKVKKARNRGNRSEAALPGGDDEHLNRPMETDMSSGYAVETSLADLKRCSPGVPTVAGNYFPTKTLFKC